MDSPTWRIKEDAQESRLLAARQRWMLVVFIMKQEMKTKKMTKMMKMA